MYLCLECYSGVTSEDKTSKANRKANTMANNYKVTIDNIERVMLDPYTTNYRLREMKIHRAKVHYTDASGKHGTFYADSVTTYIASGGCGVYLFMYFEDEAAKAQFMTFERNEDSTVKIGFTVQPGDQITIRATEKDGKLTRVKLISK